MSESTIRPLVPPGSRCRYQGSGDRVGHVEIGRLIGAGPRCLVQEARDSRSSRELVIKYLRPEHAADPMLRQRFEAAGRALLLLEHPTTARILGIGTEPLPFRLVQHMEHETLAARRAREGQLSATVADRIVAPLAEALREGHRRGLLFGALDASRVFLNADGSEVKLSWSTLVDVGPAEERDGSADLAALQKLARGVARAVSSEEWAALTQRADDFGERLQVGDTSLRRVGTLDVLNDSEAMAGMAFRIEGERDKWRSRQQRGYVSVHQKIEDAGWHQTGGRASFVVRGLSAGQDLLIISRIVRLDPIAAHELWIDGVRAETRPALTTRRNAWANLLYVVPGALLASPEARIELRIDQNDYQHYHYWFYQPDDGTALGTLPASITQG
jgi:hypothetical protein